jgi:hypothetical protein
MTVTLNFEMVMHLFKMLISYVRYKVQGGGGQELKMFYLDDMSVCNPAPAPELTDGLFRNLIWTNFTNYC